MDLHVPSILFVFCGYICILWILSAYCGYCGYIRILLILFVMVTLQANYIVMVTLQATLLVISVLSFIFTHFLYVTGASLVYLFVT